MEIKLLNDIWKNNSGIGDRGIRFISGENDEEFLSYKNLYYNSIKILGFLQSVGLRPREELLFQIDDNKNFIQIFWACIMGGIIPVPVSVENNNENITKIFKIWNKLNNPKLITSKFIFDNMMHIKLNDTMNGFKDELINKSILIEEFNTKDYTGEFSYVGENDIAFIQFSSGSTGDPKGVMLTHKNIITNIKDMAEAIKIDETDSVLSWLPLTHDMGLIGAHFTQNLIQINQNILPISLFMKRPTLWLKKASQHKVTMLTCPNFGYSYFLNYLKKEEKCSNYDIDLSRIRLIANGAEPIANKVCDEFLEYMQKYKLRKNSMLPVYGLAEATLAVTFSCLDEEVKPVIVDKYSLKVGSKVITREFEDDITVTFMDVGYPVAHCKVRICNDEDNELGEMIVGHIQISGDNVISGYYNDYVASASLLSKDGWLNTGDLGFMRNGRLIVTGRYKDIIIVNGQNYYAHDIERIVKSIDQVSIQEVVACAISNEEQGKEELILFVLNEKSIKDFVKLNEELRDCILSKIGIEVKEIVPVREMPKTVGGKVQRYKLIKQYISGLYNNDIEELRKLRKDHRAEKIQETKFTKDELEKKLAEIIEKVLGIKDIGLNDNFFELGGHSLKATILAGRIHNELNVEVPLKEIFSASSIKELSEYILAVNKRKYESIQVVELKEYYEASSKQKKMYMLQELNTDTVAYNIPIALEIQGNLEIVKLEEVFKKLIKRHETMRTSFHSKGEKIVQKIHPLEDLRFKIETIEIKNEEEIEGKIKEFIRLFDLENAPLLRVAVMRLEKNRYIMLVDMHHIISDGFSISILTREFGKLYSEETLEDLRVQYKDYAEWQSKKRETEEFKKQEEYWLKEFSGEIPVLNLPTDYRRTNSKDFSGDSIDFVLDKEKTEMLRKIAKETGSTMYMVLLANIKILLSKYSGQDDIVIGSPIAGRTHRDLENIFGMFMNTLAIRSTINNDLSFKDYLKCIKEKTLKAYENQDYQIEDMVEKLNIKRDSSRSPLFDVMFILQNMDIAPINIDGLNIKPFSFKTDVSKLDITITAVEQQEELHFNIEFAKNLYKKETMNRLIENYLNVLKITSRNKETKIKDIEIISETEKQKILMEFNNTKINYSKNKTIKELFEDQVNRTPNDIALVCENINLTYDEINQKANKLARLLNTEYKVNKGETVAIHMNRSIEMIIGIIATIKLGAVCLPVETKNPINRVTDMMIDSKAKVVLNNTANIQYKGFNGFVVDINNINLNKYDSYNLESKITLDDLAYLIYTSGSTGKPKAVMITHKGIVNNALGNIIETTMMPQDVCCHNLSFNFVASIWLIFAPLFIGSKIHLYNEEIINDPYRLFEKASIDKVSIIEVIPSVVSLFLELCGENLGEIPMENLRTIILTGEKVTCELVNKFYSKYEINLINAYGQSECSDDTLHYHIPYNTNTKKVFIGKPSTNTEVFILGKDNKLQPIGIPGELCIAGDGLSKGYLNNEELTDSKFVENPYKLGTLMYMTGDLARWGEDGNIEFLGRIDHQVKIRGFRIELGEIESNLLKIQGLKEVVVIDKENENNKYLCAYYVAEKEFSVSEFRQELKKSLPEYMIPSYFVKLDSIPLSPNGKVNRKMLLEQKDDINTGSKFEAPRNELEKKLVEIWCKVLGVNNIGINDSFFELGGHSLKATILAGRIHKELNVEVPLKEIFSASSIKELSEYILAVNKRKYESIQVVEPKEYYEASSKQKKMYMLQELNTDTVAYNIPMALEIQGNLEIVKLEEVFKKLIKRHETMRTSFHSKGEKIVQKVHPLEDLRFKIETIEIKNEEEIEGKIKEFIKPFDLENAPLLRVAVMRLEKNRYIMLVDMHHIISDGFSISILTKEFGKLYSEETLEDLRVQYKDYAEWQSNKRETEEFKKQEEYWLKEFSGEIPVLNLPTDYRRTNSKDFSGDSIDFVLDKEKTEILRKIAKETGSTMYMVLLANIKILLSKYSGQDDIVIGTPIAGRTHRDLENIFGMFMNTLAIRSTINSDLSFKDYLKCVKEKTLKAYENQDYQIEDMVEKLNIKRDSSRSPLFDVMFILQNMDIAPINIDGLNIKPFSFKTDVSKLDITITAVEQQEELHFNIEFAKNLYKKETMNRMVENYVNVLKITSRNKETKIKDIEIISETEKQKILMEFNNTKINYSKNKTIKELFEDQVNRTPNDIALVYENINLTYDEINQKANKLARLLNTEYKVNKGETVAIHMNRSIEMIIGIIATIKLGAVCLPVETKNPINRVTDMMIDSKAKVVLNNTKNIKYNGFNGFVVDINNINLNRYDSYNLESKITLDDLAYLIYTSGSTGKPKAVMITHKGIVNNALGNIIETAMMPQDVCCHNLSFNFVASIWLIFAPLFIGSKIHLYNEEIINDPYRLFEKASIDKVSIIEVIPSVVSIFLELCGENLGEITMGNLRTIILTGEKVTCELVNKFYSKYEINLINAYGQSECSDDTLHYHIPYNTSTKKVFIGKPSTNTEVFILGKDNKLQPIGIPGELCIAGDGLSKGYLNNEELTASKFVENPCKLGTLMYMTGDLARWQEDGNIEFLGRIDHQVKIRGFRIELGEIESNLLKIQGLKEVVVIDKGDENNKYLCAYYVAEKEFSVSQFRQELKKSLPEYMIPSYFVKLDSIPLNPNGKVNRKMLLEQKDDINTGAKFEAPRNELEKKLVEIWCKVLGVNNIGINDNFFELGGHSIKLVALAVEISKELAINITIAELFTNPTIKDIYNIIDSSINKEERIMTRLSNNGDNNIFAFPPITGYGYSYIELSKMIDTHSIYAFNFIDKDNIIDEYIELIIKTQTEGPFILLGYSAGGSIAFEVAKGLENKGYEVSDVIMIDSVVRESMRFLLSDSSKNELKQYIRDYLENNIFYKSQKVDNTIEKQVIKKCEEYIEYVNKDKTEGTINANLHNILSPNKNETNVGIDYWKEHVSKEIKLYQGFGGHREMLLANYVEKNAQILKLILRNLMVKMS